MPRTNDGSVGAGTSESETMLRTPSYHDIADAALHVVALLNARHPDIPVAIGFKKAICAELINDGFSPEVTRRRVTALVAEAEKVRATKQKYRKEKGKSAK
jgi:hypothetical protein